MSGKFGFPLSDCMAKLCGECAHPVRLGGAFRGILARSPFAGGPLKNGPREIARNGRAGGCEALRNRPTGSPDTEFCSGH